MAAPGPARTELDLPTALAPPCGAAVENTDILLKLESNEKPDVKLSLDGTSSPGLGHSPQDD